MKYPSLFLATLITSAFALSAQSQNLLTNGDFETPPFAPSTTVTGWTVAGSGHVHEAEEGATTPSHAVALNIGGDSQGTTLSQSFATVAGRTYVLDFDSGIAGVNSSSPLQLNVQVTGSATLLNQTVTPPEAGTYTASDVVFQHYHYLFVADSATTEIRFTDVGLGNAAADTLLDSVAIVENNLIANPDFEMPPFSSPGNISDWIVGGNQHLESVAEGATSPTHAAAFSAGGDYQGNTLSQNFSTTIGQTYSVEFDAGIAGQRNGDPLQLNVQVVGGATLVDQNVTPPEASTFDPNAVIFQHYYFTFTADSTTTTLTFTDIGLGNSGADTIVDSVKVLSITSPDQGGSPTPTPTPIATPTPTPSTLPLGNADFESGPFSTRRNGKPVDGAR